MYNIINMIIYLTSNSNKATNSIRFSNILLSNRGYSLKSQLRCFSREINQLSDLQQTNDSTSFVKTNTNFPNECLNIDHKVVDIMDDASVSTVGVLSTEEFLSTKRTNLIRKEQYDNLKPHEIKKYISYKQDGYYTFDKTRKNDVPIPFKIPKYKTLVEKSRIYRNLTSDELTRNDSNDKLLFQNEKIYDKSNEEYYKSFFKDRERFFDGYGKQLSLIERKIINSNESNGNRTRISPLKYWIKPNYVSPERNEIMELNSFDLKFVMMNEAKHNSIGNSVNDKTWDALLDRAISLQKASNIRTLLRYLYSVSIPSVTNPKVKGLVDIIYKRKHEMKPKHYVYLFQALSRLKIRDQRLSDDLYEMMLCWPILRNNFIIKAVNSLSKLDMVDNILINPLKETLSNRIHDLSGRECRRIKPISIMDMFTDDMTVEFLNRCEYYKSYFGDSPRNMGLIELYLRLLRPNVYNNLNKSTKQFLADLREYRKSNKELLHEEKESTMSAEHEDISRILNIMNVKHQNCISAGQITLDIFEPTTNTVIEVNNKYQYYDGTMKLTSLAKRRHDLISAMGFRLFHIPYRWWNMLESDENKIEQIKRMFINL
ncbi:hypothetical protein MACK_002846 [Theileria orientalis]|uniref:RAP domain-containing protein n=1 Tax=Theileria orientalis TaxID=68886 RepID=A0A976MFB0_THEOR|nr:hypothetical protein MACK_002846 [Theileria orientalis]